MDSLREWFLSQKRELPWRAQADPYAVLVSEVMLQQTQVSVVIPYFLRWMEQFPSFEVLAEASEEKVLKCWEGLGYYSRARNLHKAAINICKDWGGKIPSKEEELRKIPGIGPYTAGAIRAFAFRERAPAIDGNVIRVLTRYFAIEGDISKIKTQKEIRQAAENILPEKEPWIITEALIELGALICKKGPLCTICPIKKECRGFQENRVDHFPVKSPPPEIQDLYRTVLILYHDEKVLIHKVALGQVMAGLHEFPYLSEPTNNLTKEIEETFGLKTTPIQQLPQVKHSFTRYRAHLNPIALTCLNFKTPEGHFWASKEELKKLPFSSGHRRILENL